MTPVKVTPVKVSTNERAAFFKKFNKVLEAVGHVEKKGYNSHLNYKYTLEADLMAEVRPLLVKHGLALNIKASDYTRNGNLTTVKVTVELVDIDTGWGEASVFYGEGHDSKDKGIYMAYTGAMKYFLMKSLLIPTGDDPERDAGANGSGEKKAIEMPKPAKAKTPHQALKERMVSVGVNTKGKYHTLLDIMFAKQEMEDLDSEEMAKLRVLVMDVERKIKEIKFDDGGVQINELTQTC